MPLHKHLEKIGNPALPLQWPLSMFCLLSLHDCYSMWVWSAQVVSASLMVTTHLASASQIAALHIVSASQVAAVQWTLASLMASAVLALFWCLQGGGPPATLGVSDRGVGEGKWLIGMVSSIVAAHGGTCKKVGIGSGVAESALSLLRGSSSLISGGAHRVTDVDLLGVVCPGTRLQVLSTALDSSSWSLAAMLVWVAVSLGHSMAECREEGSVEALWGAGAMGIQLPNIMLKRSTCNSKGLQMDSWRVSMSQAGGSRIKNCTGSKPPFRPSGYTTWFQHCRSLHTSSCLRCSQVLLLGMSCIIVIMYPSQDRGCARHPHWATWRYRPNHCLCQWVGWVSMLPHPKRRGVLGMGAPTLPPGWTLSPTMVLSSAIKRNTMSHLGFSMFPHAPAWERAKSSDQVTSLTWNCHCPLLVVCNQRKSVS